MEKEIGNMNIELITPAENHIYGNYDHLFVWKRVDGARTYHFQIVKGDFYQPLQMVVDTNLSVQKFYYSLSPGSYNWRVKAYNAGSETPYSSRSLTIDSSDISTQKVLITSPVAGTIYRGSLRFGWGNLYGSDQYFMEVDTITGNFVTQQLLVNDSIPVVNSASVSVPKTIDRATGSFKWRVRAAKNNTYSQYSDVGSFIISPAAPVLMSPANNNTATPPVALSWKPQSGAGSYVFHVKDSTDQNISGYPLTVDGTSYSFNPATGKYFKWSVTAKDVYGNFSDTSDFRVLKITE